MAHAHIPTHSAPFVGFLAKATHSGLGVKP